MKPRLMRSGLTGTLYIVTRYTERTPGHFVASQKYPVDPADLEACGLAAPPAAPTNDLSADVNLVDAAPAAAGLDVEALRRGFEEWWGSLAPKIGTAESPRLITSIAWARIVELAAGADRVDGEPGGTTEETA